MSETAVCLVYHFSSSLCTDFRCVKKTDENMFYNLLTVLHHSEQKAEATVCVSFPSEIFEMLTQEDNVKHTKHVFLNNAVQPALKTAAQL